jgi:hypothetical protein
VATDDGLHGWGEAYVTRGQEKVIAECITCMVPYLIGQSAFGIRHLGQVLFDDFAIRRASTELLSAWSAVKRFGCLLQRRPILEQEDYEARLFSDYATSPNIRRRPSDYPNRR